MGGAGMAHLVLCVPGLPWLLSSYTQSDPLVIFRDSPIFNIQRIYIRETEEHGTLLTIRPPYEIRGPRNTKDQGTSRPWRIGEPR